MDRDLVSPIGTQSRRTSAAHTRNPSQVSVDFTPSPLVDNSYDAFKNQAKQQSHISVTSTTSRLTDPSKPLPALPVHVAQRKRFIAPTGWRYGVWVATSTAIAALLINLIITIWAATHFGIEDGIGTAIDGDCTATNNYATWIHIGINVVGSLLLAASNYCMQCLAAPTRDELDQAHARGDWFDIGVLSVRNILKLNRMRIFLWSILAISSIPIHLVYNSTVFKTLSANAYQAFVVNDAFVQGQPFSLAWVGTGYGESAEPYSYTDMQLFYTRNTSVWTNLTMEQCLRTYANDYVEGYSNVLLVVYNTSTTVGAVYLPPMSNRNGAGTMPYSWLCDGYGLISQSYCNPQALINNASTYTLSGYHPSYCLAQQSAQHCKLQFSTTMLIVVIVANATKAVVMLSILIYRRSPTLVVVGDAIASYLDEPDEVTKGLGLLSKYDAQAQVKAARSGGSYSGFADIQSCSVKETQPSRWLKAATRWQWTSFTIISSFSLILTASLLGAATSSAGSNRVGGSVFTLEFGGVSPVTMIDGITGYNDDSVTALTSAIILANLPQLLMSTAYLLFNGLFTIMLLAHEWSSYAVARMPLRVTAPVGQQRSTYWLHLPFLYSFPLLAASILMHWLISESIFLARVETVSSYFSTKADVNSSNGTFTYGAYNWAESSSILFYMNTTAGLGTTKESTNLASSLGYSPSPILCTLMVGLALFLTIFVFAYFRRFKSAMPLASSCSLAIAAACHQPRDDYRASVTAVQWGETTAYEMDDRLHYSFTSFHVDAVLPLRRATFLGSWWADSWLQRRLGELYQPRQRSTLLLLNTPLDEQYVQHSREGSMKYSIPDNSLEMDQIISHDHATT